MPLEKELEYFEAHRGELFSRYPYKFVVIKGDEVLGAYDSDAVAYQAGVSRFGLEPFLTRQVLPTDPIAHSPAIYTGLTSITQ